MKEFEIEVMETLSKIVKVEAEDSESAILKAKKLYYNEEIILDSKDYQSTEFFDINHLVEILKRKLEQDNPSQ